MKKILSLVLAAVMVLSVFALTGCGEQNLSFGMGVYTSSAEVKNAEGDVPGSVSVEQTVAAVIVDKDGKIVACDLDTVSVAPGFDNTGKFIGVSEIESKYEMGKDYNMVAYANAKYEWFEQADNFCKLIVGKTIDEVKALVAEGNKGTDEVISAGCTIMIDGFVLAVEKACKNASQAAVSKTDKVNVAIVATQGETLDATADTKGKNEIEVAFSAAAVNTDGKVSVMSSDAATVTASFSNKGVADAANEVVTKKEQGDKYGMVAYANAEKEWFEQAAAFDGICAGKTADEIAALETKGYGTEEVQSAGCTIEISDMTKAAVKAATVK